MRRYSWLDGEEYDEILSLEPSAVRLDRLNLGAPFLDTHCSYALENVIGSIVPDSARIEGGKGIAKVKLSKADRAADTVQDIKDGVIRNISVGYWIHKVIKTEGDGSKVARWDVVDWEPLEVSAVPIPADPGSQIRSESAAQDGSGPSTRSCSFITTTSPARAPKPQATSNKESRMAPRKPAATRGKTVAELEAENRRLSDLLAAKRAEDDKKDDERDADDEDDKKDKESDDERDGDSDSKKDDDADDERDGDMDDDERDADDEDDKRDAPSAASVRAAAAAAVKAERERSADITSIAERAGLVKLGRKHIDKGTSVRSFKYILLERMLDKQSKDAPIRGLSADEDVTRERGAKSAPTSQERQMADGANHWRKVVGKPEKTNA